MRLSAHGAFLAIVLGGALPVVASAADTLWYDRPAEAFEEALVLGNGKMGATVYGGVESEQIHLNDATLWSGGPVADDADRDVSALIPQIREALAREDYRTAERLNQNVSGRFTESFAPLGTLHIEQRHDGAPQHYRRTLDLGRALATVNYEAAGVAYAREYFVSHPDRVFAIKISASQPRALNLRVRFTSLLRHATAAREETLQARGYAPAHAEPDYMGDVPNAVRFDETKGTRFSAQIRARTKDGRTRVSDEALEIEGASEVILYVTTATSFNGFDRDPVTQGLDCEALARRQLDEAFAKSYATVREAHVKDFRFFFDRVKLDLHGDALVDLPTDERLKRYTAGGRDSGLETLYFQFGRYLLISSSRTPGVPANLQGIWNPYLRPPWSSNYTMNINAEENYWLAEPANLAEMHRPFLDFLQHLAVTGRRTAKLYYGIDQGWAAAHNSDIWAQSNPAGGYGKIPPRSTSWNMAGAWAVTHLWEHYRFTTDKAFLRDHAYPLMKGAAEFCLAWMVEDKDGHFITSPSTSPEAHYITPDGFVGATFYGGTADIAMIRECLTNTLAASRELGIDADFSARIETALEKLLPYRIGARGNLQEWYHDWSDEEPQHRHQSHLFGVYPGHQITPERTPQLADAARTSLDLRGDRATGWSTGWRINLWARLRDGNRAYRIFRGLLTHVQPGGAGQIDYTGGGGTYPNLLDAHPPFQIDGNFGGAAGVAEMLLQSDESAVYLLPALPDAWASGSVSGLCARGGFEIAMNWKDGALVDVEVLSKIGGPCSLHYRRLNAHFATKAGERFKLDSTLTLLSSR